MLRAVVLTRHTTFNFGAKLEKNAVPVLYFMLNFLKLANIGVLRHFF